MDFTSIGNINRYVKTMNMKHIWQQKANNPFKGAMTGNTSKASNEPIQRANPFGDERLMGIKFKMQSGKKLSPEDMDYLREKDPATYDEVIKMEREKEAFQKELNRCKTKEDARMLHFGKVTAALTAVKSGAVSAEVALARLARMTEAYQTFTETAHYSSLAETDSELASAIEAEKAALASEGETRIKENADFKQQLAEHGRELQYSPHQARQIAEAEIAIAASPSDHPDGAKAAEAEGPSAPVHSNASTIVFDTKTSPAPERMATKYSGQISDADVGAATAHSKIDRRA